ncbi:MAG: DNA-protecting protein DprA [Proteobacteria bacterium]|nr:DNA-protecting protein DprA [Pseudomonadota bacterium]
MEITEDLAAWVALSRTPGLSIRKLQAALAAAGNPAAVLRLPADALAAAGIDPTVRHHLTRHAGLAPDEQRWLETPGHHLLPYTDARYPPLLLATEGGPLALYVYGEPARLLEPQLAIVGSRNPTAAGTENAFAFARHLALQGLAITSGLAQGIDAAAHRGALSVPAPTIAVLGTGIDLIYPRLHAQLSRQIVVDGVLVSEFPLGTPPRAGNFPRRNRLIAGLSLGTLVIEAAHRSGSLITARLAGEAGREVFALPGSIHNPLARGCHRLIRDGAKLVENVADILSELNFSCLNAAPRMAQGAAAEAVKSATSMDKVHEILLDALGFEPLDLDVLVLRTGFKPEQVSSMMLILELEGHVKSAHGGRYMRIVRSP